MDEQLFSVKCFFFKKTFVSQRNGTPIYNDPKEVAADNLDGMLEHIWKIIIGSGSLEREIVVEGDSVGWSAEVPDISNNQIDKFAQIYDPKGRRSHTPTGISTDLLASLRNKEIHVIVFAYSRNVSTSATYGIVKKNLLDPAVKDRSTAVANLLIDDIIEKLKQAHSHHLTSPQPIGWRIWATYISSKPSHSHEQLILDTPPDHVVLLFRNVPTNEAQVLANTQQGLRVARNVNGYQRENLRGLRERVELLQAIVGSCQQEICNLVDHIDYLEKQAEREETLLCDIANSVQPTESSFSIQTAGMVVDAEDLDHME